MKFAKLAWVMVVTLILGIGLGCSKKNLNDVPPVVPTEDVSTTSGTTELTDTSSPEPQFPGQEEDTAKSSTSPKPDPGANRRQAPDFTLADLSGSQHSLSDFRGKVVLVDFWATWCGPCRKEIPHLVKFYDAYSSQGFVILGVGLDKEANLSRFANQNGISYIVLVDEKGVAGKLYGIRSIPRTLIIDKKGRIAFDHTGFPSGMEVEMEAEILTLLAEKY
ncbi:MAG: TlpA disulfide reductase family protein [candidate division WOR-3 bacterium]|nr:TlpA disulfide reductase family protein [candidate division WOR-3 bacterium]